MKYILKHKDIPVLEFVLDNDYTLRDMGNVIHEERLPFGSKYKDNEKAQFRQLSDWIEKRGLPRGRSDLTNIEMAYNSDSIKLLFGSYALNLSDHYWAHKINDDIKWKDVNFFENIFSSVIDFDADIMDHYSDIIVAPDLTVDGTLRKSWVLNKAGERLLIKDGKFEDKQEPFNEVIASQIMNMFAIDHVTYNLIRSKKRNMPLSVCKCMVDKNTELMPAQFVIDSEEKNNRANYERFINICNNNGIQNAKAHIDNMIVIDYFMGNVDRHTSNFGILRDVDSLQWLCIAPIFDNGYSLFCHEKHAENIINKTDSRCKWLEMGHYKALGYIDYPEWYCKHKARRMVDIIRDTLSTNENMSDSKRNAIMDIMSSRITIFENIINNLPVAAI
jgi:hypothetical protein